MREGRWTTVTESDFDHEHSGLEAIRHRLPDAEPWRAWSNFTFTANGGHVREVDLLIVAPSGVWLVELKNWHGTLTSENGSWVQITPAGHRRAHGNPYHLASRKARELGTLLRGRGTRAWVGEAVCFTGGGLRINLPPHDQQGVYTVDQLVTMLNQPQRDPRRMISVTESRQLRAALDGIGIGRSEARLKVGSFVLQGRSFDHGPTWVDYQARHSELPQLARVRIYLQERGAESALRESVERAARREAAVLNRFQHPGVVRLRSYEPANHPAGPALIFDYHRDTLRLDDYLVQYGERLDMSDRMKLVRQLAETVRAAHANRLHHRALAARSVHVVPRPRGPRGEEPGAEAALLTPQLQISDWHIATQRGTGRDSSSSGTARHAPTALSAGHLAEGADPYLAPELTATSADPVSLDVYGLGVLTYFLVTGAPPAASQAELVARLEAGQGLRPSALVDGLSEYVDELVQAATAYRPGDRVASVDDFLEMLEVVEEELAEPIDEHPEEPEKDPLDVVAGDVLADRWEVRRRLGTGSTSRAFLVRDLRAAPGTRSLAVLKVAVSDSRGEVLAREAETMRRLRPDSRVIRLVEPEPLTIGGRTVLALEYVGDERDEATDDQAAEPGARKRRREETVARQLRENGRLPVDQLEAYGDYLFGAVDFLEGEGVWHRDIKPDNIAIRIRPNRTRQLVLIDFSLSGYPANQVDAGTDGYLDPFLEIVTRGSYDWHAERYALAVTLHEMASGELPKWGDGSETPRQTDARTFPHPVIEADAFDPAVRDGLVDFFKKALHRDATQRYPELRPMRDAWKRVFLDAAQTVTPSHRSRHPEPGAGTAARAEPQPAQDRGPAEPAIADAEPVSAEEQRERQAAEATRGTHLSASGLTQAAQSVLYGIELTTVGELLDYSRRKLVNVPGMGAKTRTEIQRRQREWGRRLREQPESPLSARARAEAKEELTELEDRLSDTETSAAVLLAGSEAGKSDAARALRSVTLDTLGALLVPEVNNNGSNRNKAEIVRQLLRLPDQRGELPDIAVWPMQKDVVEAVGLSAGTVSRLLKEERLRWRRHPAVQALRAEIMELLATGLGRVAPAAEVADALVLRRGTQLADRDQRRALALAAVRAVVEAEELVPEEAEFQHQTNRGATEEALGAGLLALDVGPEDAPDTPTGPGLLDYATKLGTKADRLATRPTLPTAATVLAELAAVPPPPGAIEWDERRMVQLAAAASRNAAATPRLEIYPRDLSLVRALRLTQAGLVRHIPGVPEARQPGLRPEDVHERVRARFPELVLVDASGVATHELPTGGRLTKALADAGFDLKLTTREDTKTLRYLPARNDAESSYLTSAALRRTLRRSSESRYADDPEVAARALAQERLESSAVRDGFRVLTVRQELAQVAVGRLGGAANAAGVAGVAGVAGEVGDGSAPVTGLATGSVGAEALSVTAFFLTAMHGLVEPGRKPTWETLLRADVAESGTRSALHFTEYARTAWGAVEPRIRERLTEPGAGAGPLLLTDATVFARYDAMGVLNDLAELARRGGRGLWLLVPQEDPAREPRLGRRAVPYQAGLGEWIQLPDAWVAPGRKRRPEVAVTSASGGAGAGFGGWDRAGMAREGDGK